MLDGCWLLPRAAGVSSQHARRISLRSEGIFKSYHMVFYIGCTTFHAYQQCTSGPISLRAHQRLVLPQFFMLAVLIGV